MAVQMTPARFGIGPAAAKAGRERLNQQRKDGRQGDRRPALGPAWSVGIPTTRPRKPISGFRKPVCWAI
jgi:hypothetical protein